MNTVLPTLGSKGTYVFTAPFNTLSLVGEVYTCQAIRTISDLTASGVDVFKKYYNPYGLSQAIFNAAIVANDYIISLQGSSGQWVYIPSNYITSLPNQNGVPYHAMVIGLSIGPIAVSKDLSAIKTILSNAIYDSLGITPDVKEIEVSGITLVDDANHLLIENTRALHITNHQSDAQRYLTTLNSLNTALVKVKALEDYIVSKKTVLGI